MKRREYVEDKDGYDIYFSTTDYKTYCKVKECVERALSEDNKSEMDKLEDYLSENNYDFIRRSLFDGEQIVVFGDEKHDGRKWETAWDVVCHKYSIGYEQGLLEIMWKNGEVEGNLSADDIIEIIS